jgi:hypothetical protein
VETGGAIETPFDITVDFDIAGVNFSKVRALGLSTPLPFEFHDVSPPSKADDTSVASFSLDDRAMTFHGLGIQPPIFTA